jgi:hypothetical protein
MRWNKQKVLLRLRIYTKADNQDNYLLYNLGEAESIQDQNVDLVIPSTDYSTVFVGRTPVREVRERFVGLYRGRAGGAAFGSGLAI